MTRIDEKTQKPFSHLQVAAACRLFKDIETGQLSGLLHCFQLSEQQHTAGQVIFSAGSDQNCIGMVVEGEVLVQKEDVSGERLILAVFEAADLFGEVSAFSGSGVWLNTVIARTDCRIWLIPVHKISHPCSDSCFAHQTLIQNMLTIVSQRAMTMNRRIHYLQMKKMRQKLAAFLYDHYLQNKNQTFMVPFNRESMADYLNVSRPSMSRELGRMRDEGIIDFYRQAFTIKNLQALRLAE